MKQISCKNRQSSAIYHATEPVTHRPRQGHRASAGLSDVLRVAFQDYFVKFIYSSVQMTLITQKGLFGAIEGSAVFHVNVFIFGQITLYPPRRAVK